MMAMVLLGLKRLDEAHSAAQQGSTLKPDNWEGHALLGDIAIHRHQWAIAEEHYRRSLSIEPLHAPVLNALGVALVRQGKEQAGLHAFRASAAADPRLRHAKRNFWLVVAGSPSLLGADWRQAATAAVAALRRKRRLRLARVKEDPPLRDFLERVQRDATVKRYGGSGN